MLLNFVNCDTVTVYLLSLLQDLEADNVLATANVIQFCWDVKKKYLHFVRYDYVVLYYNFKMYIACYQCVSGYINKCHYGLVHMSSTGLGLVGWLL